MGIIANEKYDTFTMLFYTIFDFWKQFIFGVLKSLKKRKCKNGNVDYLCYIYVKK